MKGRGGGGGGEEKLLNVGEEMGCGFTVAGLEEGAGGEEKGKERKAVLISPSCFCLHLFS